MNIGKETPILSDGFNIPSVKSNLMLQCLTYIPKDNLIISGYKQITSQNEKYCDLVKYNLSGNIIKRYENLELYHLNDITYNPKTNELIIIPMTDLRGNNYIYKYDYNTMTKKSEFKYTNNSYLVGIAYDNANDNANDKYILVGAGNTKDTLGIIINNSNFVFEKQFIIGKNNRTFQSVEVYENMIFIYFNHEIEIRDYDGNLITIYKFNTKGESEGICHIENGEFLIGLLDNSSYSTMAISSKVMKFKVKEEGKMNKIFLDFGHGGSDSGAVANGLVEKNMTLVTGLSCRDELLKYNVQVQCSRISDIAVGLDERCRMSNAWDADYFISIHYNAGGGDRGEVIHSIYRGEGLELSNCIAEEMKKLGQDTVKVYEKKGTDNKDYYAVIRGTNCNAVIVEGAFIDNVTDKQLVDTIEEQKAMGVAIAHGILKQLGIPIKVEQSKKYWVITDYIPVGEYGFESKGFLAKYFSDIPGVYFRSNPTGIWAETCYLPIEKCNELKVRLGNLFYQIKEH